MAELLEVGKVNAKKHSIVFVNRSKLALLKAEQGVVTTTVDDTATTTTTIDKEQRAEYHDGKDPEAGGASSTAREDKMDVDDPHHDPREGSATATDDDEDIEEWEVELNNAIAEYGKGGLFFVLFQHFKNNTRIQGFCFYLLFSSSLFTY